MTSLTRDLRYAFRSLVKSPGYTAAAVLTLALGIGANSAIFSVVRGVLWKPLPYPDPDRIVEIHEIDASGDRMAVCWPNLDDFERRSRSFRAVAGWAAGPTSVTGGSQAVRATAATVSRRFFDAIGVRPSVGREFVEEERRLGGAPAVVVSDAFWRRFLSDERDLSRRGLRFDGNLYRVVGVMPPGFDFPDGAQLWTPAERLDPETSRSAHNWKAVGRLRDGVRLATARADLQAIAREIRKEHGGDADLAGASARPLRDSFVAGVRPGLQMLLGAVAFLMLVAGANATNLALARTASRTRELAVRTAIGASRWDLLRVLLAECLIVALAGAGAGLLLCVWSLGAIRTLAASSLPRADGVAIDAPVFAFAAALSVLSALAVAVVAARRSAASRVSVLSGGRSAGAPATLRAQGLLLATQASLTALLLAGLALFARSFLGVLRVSPGFRAEGVLAMDLDPPWAGTAAERARRTELIDRLVARLGAIPGMKEVGAVGSLPLGSDMADGTFVILDGRDAPARPEEFDALFADTSRTGHASYCAATSGYFRAMGIPLRRGRLFDDRDGPGAPHVALISQELARTRFANLDPIGQRIEFGNMDGDLRVLTVVGVVGDVRPRSLEEPPESILYVHFLQRPHKAYALTTVMRVDGDLSAVAAAAQSAAREIDPTLPPRIRPLEEVVARSVDARRFSVTLLAIFGGLALLLSTGGIASVTAFSVARRRRELGIRLAIGAKPSDLFRLLVSRHVRFVAAGGAAGLVAAAIAARLLRSQLFGVAPTDLVSFAASAFVLFLVATAACAVPARQVARIDPAETFRTE